MARHRLTDDQLKLIMESEDQPLHVVATRMDKSASTIWYARNRLGTGKWACEVRYAACQWCGETVTLRCQPKSQRYHPHCAKEANRESLRRRDAARPKDPQKLERLKVRTREIQQQTMDTAVRKSAKWTPEEDAIVREMLHLPIVQTALRLERTRSSVATRRATFRRWDSR